MEKPLLAKHEVISIAPTDAEVPHIDTNIGGYRISRPQLIVRLDASALITEANEP